MKRKSTFLFGAMLAAGCFALAPAAQAQKPPGLQAGAAEVDVSPQIFPMNMPGGTSANMATGLHDPLHARALVLDDGTTALALVVVDNLGLGREVADDAKQIAFERCGLPMDKMLICSTHTHTGASAGKRDSGPVAVIAYRKLLVEGIAEAIVKAHGARRPASVGAASHPLPEEVFNRRWYLKPGHMQPNPFGQIDQVKTNAPRDVLDRPAGPTDPDVTIISVQGEKRKPLALLANYSLHYVGGSPKGLMSADYFGEFARIMPSRVGGGDEFVAMMSNGTSGDINNIPFTVTRPPRAPYEQIRIVARKAADAAWFARQKITEHDRAAKLGMIEREITLRMRRPTPEQIAAAQAVLAVKDKAEKEKLPPRADSYARNVLSFTEGPDSLPVQLQVIRIGDLAVCGIPFETFVEIGLELKKRSPFPKTMVIGLANARHGYLPTPEQHRLGGYETWMGTNKVQEDASVLITKELLAMLAELKKEP